MHGDLQTCMGWIHNSHCHFAMSITSCPFNIIKGYFIYPPATQKAASFMRAAMNDVSVISQLISRLPERYSIFNTAFSQGVAVHNQDSSVTRTYTRNCSRASLRHRSKHLPLEFLVLSRHGPQWSAQKVTSLEFLPWSFGVS